MGSQQGFNVAAQRLVAGTGLDQELRSFAGVQIERAQKHAVDSVPLLSHQKWLPVRDPADGRRLLATRINVGSLLPPNSRWPPLVEKFLPQQYCNRNHAEYQDAMKEL